MKKLGRFCALVALTLSIALTSYAGHIDCGDMGEMPQPAAAGEVPNNITNVLLIMLSLV